MSIPIGRKIDLLLAEQGMSNIELAKKIGMLPQGLSQLKRSKKPQSCTIHKLSKAFDVPVSFFVSESR